MEPTKGPNANTAYIWIAVAGSVGSGFIAAYGGRFAGGWPLAAMVAAPALMALGIAVLVGRSK